MLVGCSEVNFVKIVGNRVCVLQLELERENDLCIWLKEIMMAACSYAA